MPVEKVYVVLDSPPGPGVFNGRFVEIEDGDGRSVKVLGETGRSEGMEVWRIGPLYRWTGTPTESLSEEIQVAARLAANDLIAISDRHEQEDHGGEPCVDNRVGILAFVAHSLGLRPAHMIDVMDALEQYAHGHDEHSHG